LIFASGCDGPLGSFHNVTFIDPPPYSAAHCDSAGSFQAQDEQTLRVTGHRCY
jgi:hypothetical protein